MRKVDEVDAELIYTESGWGGDDPYFPNMLRVEFNGMMAKVEHVLGKSDRVYGTVDKAESKKILHALSPNSFPDRVRMKTQTMHMDKLPVWIQRRIATLSTLGTTPPMPDIPGVGRRITENVYWVYFSTTDNTTTRK
tara:strand:- start:341 stop:751 length:411 start_codon:yes stop_codon:yes gene_type:complete